MQIRAALLAIGWLLLSGCRPAQGAIREGDIVFQTSRSAQSQAIQLATHSPYSHMGLILYQGGRPFVLEAIAHVQLTPLKEWTARGEGGRFVAKRLSDESVLADKQKLSALRKAALRFLGRPYDPYFEWSDERIYCSELVWKAFERGLGIKLGDLETVDSFDLSDPRVKSKLTERYGDKIPLEEHVISPAAIFESTLLESPAPE
jgi:hypothetical protein